MSASLLSHQDDAAPENPDANDWLTEGGLPAVYD